MFINLIKKSFDDVIKNPVITLFLVSYFIIISIIMSCIGTQSNALIAYTLILTAFLFIAIFIAGWFGVIKEISLQNPNEPKKRSYIAIFLENIGINVIPCIIGLVICIIFSVFFTYLAFLGATKMFGNPQELITQIQTYNNPNDALEFIKSLSPDELVKLYALPLALMVSTFISMFILLYYFPAIACNSKNGPFTKAFISLKDNFCFLSKHLFKSIGYYLILCLIYVLVIMTKAFIPSNIITDTLFLFFFIYFVSFAVMLICNYYGKYYSCHNRADSLGENESNDNTGEEK